MRPRENNVAHAGESWSTEQYTGGAALRFWQELVAETLIACDISPISAEDFGASLSRYTFGSVSFQQVHSSGSHISRTREQIRRDRKDSYFIIQQRSGTVAIEQHGRTAIAGPGDCLLLSARSPYSIQTRDHFVGLKIGRAHV